jgi:mannose-6-phosphate isomerase-like protein (cupin superfamily)
MLVRYAVLGETAFALVELPASGSAGTSLETDCRDEHWGLVLGGEVTLEGVSPRSFSPGTAFHIAPGGAPHRFHSDGRAVIAGFVPLTEPVDASPEALRARGLQVAKRMPAPQAPPSLMKVSGTLSRVERRGAIELETADMGRWLFTRTTFGPLSGYTSGWCDLPHWGLVLSGDVVLNHEDHVELLTAGDIFFCPAGPPGHQFEVADQATIIDYTPVADMDRGGRQEAWRTKHRRQSYESVGSEDSEGARHLAADGRDAEASNGRVTSLGPRVLEPVLTS